METLTITDHLEKIMALKAAVEVGSIRGASEVLGLTQPSLSIKLKTIENLLGSKLLIRSRNGVVLTPEGKLVYEFSKSIFGLSETLAHRLSSDIDGVRGSIRIGFYDSIARYYWPSLYQELRKNYPDVVVSLKTGRSQDILEKLVNKELDLAITVEPKLGKSYFTKTLYQDYFSFYISKSHKKRLMNSEIKLPVFVFSKAMTKTNEYLSQEFNFSNSHYIVQEIENFEIALGFCLRGMGVAVLPTRVAGEFVDKQKLEKIKLFNDYPLNFLKHQIGVSTYKDYSQNNALKKVLDLIQDKIKRTRN